MKGRPDSAKAEGAARLNRECFGHPDAKPENVDDRKHKERGKDRVPFAECQDYRANGRGDGGEDRKDHHNKRHQARHFTARELVADNRQRHNPRPSGAKALNKA